MKNKVEIWISFNHGGWSLIFSKEFILPFPPFYNLELIEKIGEHEHEIKLENHNYCTTTIQYDLLQQKFLANIHYRWPHDMREHLIDDTINKFDYMGWTRQDTTNAIAFKNLILSKR